MKTDLTQIISTGNGRLMNLLHEPLYRNGFSLVLSSGLTSGIGFIYWIIAARKYSTETVGLNSAILGAMYFLANLSQFNFTSVLNRFIPSAGVLVRRLVVNAYLLCSVSGFVVAALFLVGVQRWAPDLEILRSNGLTIVWFLFAVVSWNIFSLQDSALTGLRRATWIPLENLTFAIAKIVLLIVFAPRFPVLGIMLSWTLPLVFLLIGTNIVLFGKFITKHIPNGKQSESLAPKKIVRFIAGDYLSTLVWIGVVEYLPILILSRLNAEACAYYFLSHTIAYFFCLVSDNMGMSLVTEGAIAPEKLMFNARRILVKCATIILPAVLIIQISAPWILLLFGKDYAQHAPMVFRLLVLSAIPHMFTSVFISTARVQKKTFEIFAVLGMLSFLLVLISYFLMDLYAIDGVGWAWLISQTIVAAVIFFTRLKPAWTGPTVVRDRGSANSMK